MSEHAKQGGSERTSAIAIIGMAGRFPGAPNLERFWENLREGVESLTPLSDDEMRAAGVPPELLHHPDYVRAATILEEADRFDAEFFGFAPREADIMDPQHRLFLECAWEAMEDAGHVPGDHGPVGVFASVTMNSYAPSVIWRNPEVAAAAGGYQLMLGNDKDFLPTRVSYKLNLKGPSLAVQTACSSSLVATWMACQSLVRHQCDMALVGGSSITIPQRSGYLYQQGMIFSPDGHCRPFDVDAAGTRAGHGVGVVLLKRLDDALADGDPIRAVILGSAINNDGAGKIGYTAPSVDGQAEVIAMAQALARVEPESIGYIEAHGTGTKLGDPIEIAALTRAFRRGTQERQYCAIGSLKSNIGHLDAAAGVAGLIKTALVLEHRQIPPSLNFSEPNPEIDFERSPFFVNARLSEWNGGSGPRRAGVSSFGIGGTNAHVVVEEAPRRAPSPCADRDRVFVISARNDEALQQAAENLGACLSARSDLDVGDAAFTMQVGRRAFARRRFTVCGTREEAAAALTGGDAARVLSGTAAQSPQPVTFMFSGQGSQYPGMGKALYDRYATFRSAVDRCADILEPSLGCDLRDPLMNGGASAGEASAQARLQETWLTQPALFTIEYAMASLWSSWGVRPASMIGHSIGEWVAAHLAGVFSLEDALDLVAARGRLIQALPGGTMMSVSLPEGDVVPWLDGTGSLAGVNGPSLCTVSGTTEAMQALAANFEERDVPFRRLHTSHAFHSDMMDPILAEFRERVAGRKRAAPSVPFVSNVTGTWITDEQARDPAYWAQHIRLPVRFLDGIRQLGAESEGVLLEVGPGNVLATFARQSMGLGAGARIVSSLPHPKDPVPADRFALEALGRLWLSGANIDWSAVGDGARRRVSLPAYPFQRKRYWIDPPKGRGVGASGPLMGKNPDMADWFYVPSWARSSVLEADGPGYRAAAGPWLVFVNASPLAARMVERLKEAGRDVITVAAGTGFEESPSAGYTIDPAQREHYGRLWQSLAEAGRLPHRILHLWTAPGSVENDAPKDPAALARSQDRGVYSLLHVAQALGRHGSDVQPRIIAFTTGMASVLDDAEVSHPENATLAGPVKVIPIEYPHVDARLIDLSPDVEEADDPSLVRSLLDEAVLERPSTLVAYRAGRRWEQFYERVRLAEGTNPTEGLLVSGTGGVYLITGGLGGLGLVFARQLASAGACVLALTGRTPLPPRAEWDAYLEEHAEGRIANTLRGVREIEAMGSVVVPVTADAANEGEMTAAFREVVASHGPLTGIIHAAGVPATGVMQLKTREGAATVIDPKLRGAMILDALVGERPLDFFVLFSSINSVYAVGGGSDYCSANSFLDAFARYRRSRGDGRVVAVNWDPWQEVGMAVDADVPPQFRAAHAEHLRNGILPSEGVEACRRILRSRLPQVVVSTQDLSVILQYLAMARAARAEAGDASLEAGLARGEETSRHARPELPNPYVAPRTDNERLIVDVWQELLGIDGIGVHDNFFELGGHSLLATRVLAHLHERTGLSFPLEAVFEAPTVAELAERVDTLQWVASAAPGKEDEDGSEREEFVF